MKTPLHRLSMEVRRSGLWAPGHYHHYSMVTGIDPYVLFLNLSYPQGTQFSTPSHKLHYRNALSQRKEQQRRILKLTLKPLKFITGYKW